MTSDQDAAHATHMQAEGAQSGSNPDKTEDVMTSARDKPGAGFIVASA